MLTFLAIGGFGVMAYFGIAAMRNPAIRQRSSFIAIGGLFLLFIVALRIPTTSDKSKSTVVAQAPTSAAVAEPTETPATPEPSECSDAKLGQFADAQVKAMSTTDIDEDVATTLAVNAFNKCTFEKPPTQDRAMATEYLGRAVLFGYAHGSHRRDFLDLGKSFIEIELNDTAGNKETVDSLHHSLDTIEEKLALR